MFTGSILFTDPVISGRPPIPSILFKHSHTSYKYSTHALHFLLPKHQLLSSAPQGFL